MSDPELWIQPVHTPKETEPPSWYLGGTLACSVKELEESAFKEDFCSCVFQKERDEKDF